MTQTILRSRRFALATLLAVAAVSVLAGSAPASTSTGLPSPQELPPGAVAVVMQSPAELKTITTHDFERAMAQAAAQAGLKRTPQPGDKQYEELKEKALGEVFDTTWIQGQAAEMGITVTKKEVATELAQIKKQNFKTGAEYRRFLRKFHFTRRDVNERVELQLLSTRIQTRVGRGAKSVSELRGALKRFVAAYSKRWRSRTVCASGYVIDRCSNAHEPART